MSHQARLPTAVREYEPAPPSFALKDWKIYGETKVLIGWFKLKLWMWLVDLNYNFECDWLIELSDNKRSDYNSDYFVENRSFFNQSESRKLWFFFYD